MLLISTVVGIWSFANLNISENIDSNFPGNQAFKSIKPILDRGKETIIFSLALSPGRDTPASLEEKADSLISYLDSEAGNYLADLQFKSDIDIDSFGIFLYRNLHLFLDSTDYTVIESRLNPGEISSAMRDNKNTLFSPEGLMLKNWLLRDPLHLMELGYNKLKQGVVVEDLIENEGLFISRDQSKLFIYGRLKYNSSESKNNEALADILEMIKSDWNVSHPDYQLDYFGTFLIANANAQQITRDIKLTLSIALLVILALLIYYYRSASIIGFFLIPGVFGVLIAGIGLYFWQGHISGIALGASAVVLGIVVDYSFHFFSQFKINNDAFKTRNQILLPLLTSGITTIAAFLSLTFAQSQVLHDFGLFTAFSLAGALVFVLAILPVILKPFEKRYNFSKGRKIDRWFENLDIEKNPYRKWYLGFITLATAVFLYFATDIQFESNINNINYYPPALKIAEEAHQNINPDTEKRINFLVAGQDKNDVVAKNLMLFNQLIDVEEEFEFKQINSLGLLMLSDSLQEQKINVWDKFWASRNEQVWKDLSLSADSLRFKRGTFKAFHSWISTTPKPENLYEFVTSSKSLSQLILPDNGPEGNFNLVTNLVLPKANYEKFKEQFSNLDHAVLVDGVSVMEILVETVKADINYLLIVAAGLVLLILLLVYGRIELTLITFLPMVISWIWILGISVLLGIKFNFVNIIIVTFIFGLGDDFAIFITDGLQSKYKYNRKILGHYRTAIALSAFSTIIGTGVLFFAGHPAIKSIAAISVIGITTIVFISFFVQPLLYRFFTTRRASLSKPPVTVSEIFLSVIGYSIFIFGSLIGVTLGYLVRIIPFAPPAWKKLMVHRILMTFSGIMLDIIFTSRRRYFNMNNLDFSNPSIIIANHSSFFDILALARLNPKILMLVNHWVYYSPLFGPLVRYADYIPTFDSLEDNLIKIKKLLKKGYSLAVFPEGRRSADGKIGRFHKGPFYLAEKLNLDITPVLLHGFGYTMPKHDYNLKWSDLSTKILPRIKPEDPRFGTGYKERSKAISQYFRNEYEDFKGQREAMNFQFYPLLRSYLYKGPLLEWYFRIKWRHEKTNYENYFQMIGRGKKRIYDLGCGYGFLSYFLKLRDDSFEVVGIDYDQNKIDVAKNSYLVREGIEFHAEDIISYQPKNADVIILADTLHYLNQEDQILVLNKCSEALNTDGRLFIRDGLSDNKSGHEWTEKSEKWSTKYLNFNKTTGDLHFFSSSFINEWAKQQGFTYEMDNQSQQSSNSLIVLTKPAGK